MAGLGQIAPAESTPDRGRAFLSRYGAWIAGGVAAAIVGIVAFLHRKEIGMTVVSITDKAKWAKYMFDAISTALPQLSVRARLIILAHAGYESGWGQTGSAIRNGTNNMFNVTAGRAWTGMVVTVKNADKSTRADECARLGRPMNTKLADGTPACWIDQTWRKYPDYHAAVLDYWDFLGPNQNRGRYVAARDALERGDIPAFAAELAKASYHTTPAATYASQLAAVFQTACKFIGVCA